MSATGAEIKFAAKRATTWGTAVACGAGDGFLIRPSSYKKTQPFNIDDSLGLGWPTDGDLGEVKVEGEVVGYLRYDSLDLLIAQVMGGHSVTHTVASLTTQTATGGSTTTAVKSAAGWTVDTYIGKFITMLTGSNAGQTRYITDNDSTTITWVGAMANSVANNDTFTVSGAASTHVYTVAESTDGIFMTAAAKLGSVSTDELVTCKVVGMTIKGAVGKPIEFSFKVIAYDRSFSSATNTVATFANVTFPETANRILYQQMVMRLNVQSAGALGSTSTYGTNDIVFPASFEFSFQRKMTGVYGVGSSTNYHDEPTSDGLPDISLKMEFGRFTSNALLTAKDAGTALKGDLVFTGALLSGATYRKLTIELPNLKFTDADVPMKEGILTHPVEFKVLGCGSAPTGMTNLTAPFRMTLINGFGGDKLLAGNTP